MRCMIAVLASGLAAASAPAAVTVEGAKDIPVTAEVDVLALDSAHGHSENILKAVKKTMLRRLGMLDDPFLNT